MNMQHVVKVRGLVCNILEDYGNGVYRIDYRDKEVVLNTKRDMIVTRLHNGKFVGLEAELHRRN